MNDREQSYSNTKINNTKERRLQKYLTGDDFLNEHLQQYSTGDGEAKLVNVPVRYWYPLKEDDALMYKPNQSMISPR